MRQVVNDALRRAMAAEGLKGEDPVALLAFDMGIQIDVTSTSAALEALEGPTHR